jgi:hypothetical protein
VSIYLQVYIFSPDMHGIASYIKFSRFMLPRFGDVVYWYSIQ